MRTFLVALPRKHYEQSNWPNISNACISDGLHARVSTDSVAVKMLLYLYYKIIFIIQIDMFCHLFHGWNRRERRYTNCAKAH